MVTCKQLMELDIFHNIKLKAGRKGLSRAVSWVYAKHTKTITPWVHGGEFLLVSGYEYGTDEAELLQLIKEAAQNNSSGILVEGGINFKEIPANVIQAANEEEMPLFFVKGVISFLDVTRDISDLIMENKYLTQKNISLLDQLLNLSSMNKKEINQLFHGSGILEESCFLTAVFTIRNSNALFNKCTIERVDTMVNFSRVLRKQTSVLFEKLGLLEIYKVNLDSVDYLLYADREEELLEVAEKLKAVHGSISADPNLYDVYLSFGSVIYDSKNISTGMDEAYFTGNLLSKNLFSERIKSFSDIGSYQLIFYVEDKTKLVTFRDRYLKKLHEADREGSSQLLQTLHEYLVQNGNVLQTSKKLYIHRNTLQYRMERIGFITNMDLNDLHTKRDFLNAFLILDMIPFM